MGQIGKDGMEKKNWDRTKRVSGEGYWDIQEIMGQVGSNKKRRKVWDRKEKVEQKEDMKE
jgi:hypothetical protein